MRPIDSCIIQRKAQGPSRTCNASNEESGQVVSIVPGSAAHKSGVIVIGDKLISVDEESVFGWNLKVKIFFFFITLKPRFE